MAQRDTATGPGRPATRPARPAARPVAAGEEHPRWRAAERRIAAVTRVLDDAVAVPGTGQRVGLDAVIGLIPAVGDLASAAVGGWIILEATRFRLPRIVVARMVVNTLADLAIGAIPILGDAFDVVYRSNRRNLELFRRHAADPSADTTAHRAFLAGLILIAVGLVALAMLALGALLSVEIPPP